MGLRMKRVPRKTDQQLSEEIIELKEKRNKDLEHIKILKVELTKLEQLYKKYKETIPKEATTQIQLNLSSLASMARSSENGIVDTEDLLLEIQKVKSQLQAEIMYYRQARGISILQPGQKTNAT